MLSIVAQHWLLIPPGDPDRRRRVRSDVDPREVLQVGDEIGAEGKRYQVTAFETKFNRDGRLYNAAYVCEELREPT